MKINKLYTGNLLIILIDCCRIHDHTLHYSFIKKDLEINILYLTEIKKLSNRIKPAIYNGFYTNERNGIDLNLNIFFGFGINTKTKKRYKLITTLDYLWGMTIKEFY